MRSCFIIGCVAVIAVCMSQLAPSTRAQQEAPTPKKTYEYKLLDPSSVLEGVVRDDAAKVLPKVETAINKLASEGWEIDFVESGTFIFKRQKTM